MSKPRTFVSSTFYDLADARAALSTYLEGIGHEALMHEKSTFGVKPGVHSHAACLDEVDRADYLVLIVGGRRGGTFVASEKSITSEEYRRAIKRKIPIIIFVKNDVERAWKIYKKNPSADFSDVVDDKRIFDFIDVLKSQSEDNWTHGFDTVNDILDVLRGQFAHIHLLFSQRHVQERTAPAGGPREEDRRIVPFPSDFTMLHRTDGEEEAVATIDGLRRIHGVLAKMAEQKVQGYEEKTKVLWLLGRYGEVDSSGFTVLKMNEHDFRQRAWGSTKGERVFQQLAAFGVHGGYDEEDRFDEAPRRIVKLSFGRSHEETVWALKRYVDELVARYGEDDGLALFNNADMRLYGADAVDKDEDEDEHEDGAAAPARARSVKPRPSAPAAAHAVKAKPGVKATGPKKRR